MKSFFRFIRRQADAMIYGLIGPFSVLYLLPHFFLDIETRIGINLPIIVVLKYSGIIFMNLGLIIALWSTILLYKSRRASPSPFSLPNKVVKEGLFAVVRHPMMWSLHFVLIGQVLIYNSPMILLWFLIWWRFSVIYVARYEEPYLLTIFGKEYIEYCKNTPRWIPKISSKTKRK